METENAYYVTHPNLGATAVVYAPSTEKARTTLLDWLERHQLMRRADRQLLRKNMVAKKLDDPNVQADVTLHYGYRDVTVLGGTFGMAPETPAPAETPIEPAPAEAPPMTEVLEVPKEKTGRMPIQDIMLRGLG